MCRNLCESLLRIIVDIGIFKKFKKNSGNIKVVRRELISYKMTFKKLNIKIEGEKKKNIKKAHHNHITVNRGNKQVF